MQNNQLLLLFHDCSSFCLESSQGLVLLSLGEVVGELLERWLSQPRLHPKVRGQVGVRPADGSKRGLGCKKTMTIV